MPRRRPLLHRPVVAVGLAVGAVLAVVAVLWFEPWKLVVNQSVDEAAPGTTSGAPPGAGSRLLATGELISHEHDTTGTVQLLELADGSRVVRLVDLRTSNGPVLKVWLTDAPVLPGEDGWYVFDDARHVDLGPLKGNMGSANYPVPAGADLTGLTSLTIWCERFHVSFGAAQLTAPG